MFYSIIALSAIVSCATAFTSRASMRMAAEGMSASIPFLKNPKNLEGLAGGVGFDPLGLSETFDVKFMREAELKHGRISMLAVVGCLVQSAGIHLPGPAGVYDCANPIDAVFHVGPGPMFQIFCGIGAAESVMYNGKLSMMDMFEGTDREPGNFGKAWGADQLKGKSAAEVEIIKTKELKNGRLAMLAIGGIIHHTIIDGTETFGPISAWADKLYMPMHIGLPGL